MMLGSGSSRRREWSLSFSMAVVMRSGCDGGGGEEGGGGGRGGGS